MLDADQSAEYSPEKKFWHQEILLAIEDIAEHGSPKIYLDFEGRQ